jgi:predicted TIM-barrel fold metal-dependent hydrolase
MRKSRTWTSKGSTSRSLSVVRSVRAGERRIDDVLAAGLAGVQQLAGGLLPPDPEATRCRHGGAQDPAAAAGGRRATSSGSRHLRATESCRGCNFDHPDYEALWEVMSRHSMTLGIHEGGFPRLPQVVSGRLTEPMQVHICTHPMEQMIAAVSIVYGGVLERHPGLRVAFLEAGCGWVPFWLHRMDEHWQNSSQRDFGAVGVLRRAPSEYFRNQCYVTADSSEYMLSQVIDLIGDDHIVFTTDYPHPDSPWPHAVEEFLSLPGVSAASKGRILWDNALDLYGVEH